MVIASVITIIIQLTKTEFALGEDPTLTLELLYTGQGSMILPEPVEGSGMPIFRVVDLASGAERIVRTPTAFPGVRARVQLDSGEPHKTFHKLSRFVTFNAPGKYAISAIYEWNDGKDRAESEPIVVTVTGLGVRNMAINNPSYRYGLLTFINPVPDPSDVMLADLVLEPEGGVRRMKPVAKASLLASPVASVPPNQSPTMGQWVAWIEGDSFKAIHVGDTLGPTSLALFKTMPGAQIIHPLFAAVNKSNLTRGAGAAVLLQRHPLQGAEIIVLDLKADNESAEAIEVARAAMPKPPAWTTSVFREDPSDKRLAFITTEQDKFIIHDAPWPEPGAAELQINKVAEWEGDFVAAGVNIDHNDVIHGCALAWMGPPDERTLEVMSWKVGADGAGVSEPLGALPWSHATPIQSIKIRVRTGGMPTILLRSALGEWHVFDAAFQGKVFEPFTRTDLPIDIAFLSDEEAVLVIAQVGGGIIVKRLNGTDLPPKQR